MGRIVLDINHAPHGEISAKSLFMNTEISVLT